MFGKKYKKRIQELETKLENTENEIQVYRTDNIYLTGQMKELKKELEILPKRNKRGQFETRQKTVNA